MTISETSGWLKIVIGGPVILRLKLISTDRSQESRKESQRTPLTLAQATETIESRFFLDIILQFLMTITFSIENLGQLQELKIEGWNLEMFSLIGTSLSVKFSLDQKILLAKFKD